MTQIIFKNQAYYQRKKCIQIDIKKSVQCSSTTHEFKLDEMSNVLTLYPLLLLNINEMSLLINDKQCTLLHRLLMWNPEENHLYIRHYQQIVAVVCKLGIIGSMKCACFKFSIPIIEC